MPQRYSPRPPNFSKWTSATASHSTPGCSSLRNFDPAKKYPLLVYVYGEPAAQTVEDTWGDWNFDFHRIVADAGYIVVSFDNRGTPAPKGRAWRKTILRRDPSRNRQRPIRRPESFSAIASLCRSNPRRPLGLERRRLQHSESNVPVARSVQSRHVGRSRPRPPSLRHDLPGTLHGPPHAKCRRLPQQFSDKLRRRPKRTSAASPWQRRRQRPLLRQRTPAKSPDRTRQASRLHGIPQPHPRHKRRPRHHTPSLQPAPPLPRRTHPTSSDVASAITKSSQ